MRMMNHSDHTSLNMTRLTRMKILECSDYDVEQYCDRVMSMKSE